MESAYNKALEIFENFEKLNVAQFKKLKNKLSLMYNDQNITVFGSNLEMYLDHNNSLEKLKGDWKEIVKTHKVDENIIQDWESEIRSGMNTEFWSREDFEKFFNSELGIYLSSARIEGKTGIERANKRFKTLRDLFDKRFNNPEEKKIIDLQFQIKENQKVMVLYEFGFFDHVKEKFPQIANNDTKVAELLSKITGINKDTIRQTYAAIGHDKSKRKNNPYNNSDNLAFIINIFNELGLERKSKKGEL
jgi:hypothetical protein